MKQRLTSGIFTLTLILILSIISLAYLYFLNKNTDPKPNPKPDPKPEPDPKPKPDPKPDPKPKPEPELLALRAEKIRQSYKDNKLPEYSYDCYTTDECDKDYACSTANFIGEGICTRCDIFDNSDQNIVNCSEKEHVDQITIGSHCGVNAYCPHPYECDIKGDVTCKKYEDIFGPYGSDPDHISYQLYKTNQLDLLSKRRSRLSQLRQLRQLR